MLVCYKLRTLDALEGCGDDAILVQGLLGLGVLIPARGLGPQYFGEKRGLFLFDVVSALGGGDHGVELGDHDGALGDGAELAPGEFVDEVAEGVVVLLPALGLVDGELKFALDPAHEEVVDHDVVGGVVELVLDPDQLKLALHGLAVVEQVHGPEDVDEGVLGALELGPHKIGHPEHHDVDVLLVLVGEDILPRLQQVVDQHVGVVHHEGRQHCVDFGCVAPRLRKSVYTRDEGLRLPLAEEVGYETVAGFQHLVELPLDLVVLLL